MKSPFDFIIITNVDLILVAIVKLQNPRLLLSCDGENIGAHCPEKVVTSYCDSTGKTKCEYLQIPYKIVSSNIISINFLQKQHDIS